MPSQTYLLTFSSPLAISLASILHLKWHPQLLHPHHHSWQIESNAHYTHIRACMLGRLPQIVIRKRVNFLVAMRFVNLKSTQLRNELCQPIVSSSYHGHKLSDVTLRIVVVYRQNVFRTTTNICTHPSLSCDYALCACADSSRTHFFYEYNNTAHFLSPNCGWKTIELNFTWLHCKK